MDKDVEHEFKEIYRRMLKQEKTMSKLIALVSRLANLVK